MPVIGKDVDVLFVVKFAFRVKVLLVMEISESVKCVDWVTADVTVQLRIFGVPENVDLNVSGVIEIPVVFTSSEEDAME